MEPPSRLSDHWIEVKPDQLPPRRSQGRSPVKCLVYQPSLDAGGLVVNGVTTGHYLHHVKQWVVGGVPASPEHPVTHWMPMPQPPIKK